MADMLSDVLTNLELGNVALIIFIFSLFIDLTPGIKFNPIKWIIKQFGEAFNHSIDKKMDSLKDDMTQKIDSMNDALSVKINDVNKEIEDIKEKQIEHENLIKAQQKNHDIDEVERLKKDILDFSNRLFRKQKFTLEQYHTIMDTYKRYERIIDKYDDLENGKVDTEYEVIINHYEAHREDGEYMF